MGVLFLKKLFFDNFHMYSDLIHCPLYLIPPLVVEDFIRPLPASEHGMELSTEARGVYQWPCLSQ